MVGARSEARSGEKALPQPCVGEVSTRQIAKRQTLLSKYNIMISEYNRSHINPVLPLSR